MTYEKVVPPKLQKQVSRLFVKGQRNSMISPSLLILKTVNDLTEAKEVKVRTEISLTDHILKILSEEQSVCSLFNSKSQTSWNDMILDTIINNLTSKPENNVWHHWIHRKERERKEKIISLLHQRIICFAENTLFRSKNTSFSLLHEKLSSFHPKEGS